MKIAALLVCGLFAWLSASAQPAQQTLTNIVTASDCKTITLQFTATATANTWASDSVRVLVEVQLHNANPTILQQLLSYGRYLVMFSKDNGVLRVEMPGLKKVVTLRGAKLNEEITVKLFVPNNIEAVANVELKNISIERKSPPLPAGFATKGLTFSQLVQVDLTLKASNDAEYAALSLDDLLIDGLPIEGTK